MQVYSLPINSAARSIGIGRTKLYELINSGQLEAVKLGRRTLVKVDSISRLLNEGGRP